MKRKFLPQATRKREDSMKMMVASARDSAIPEMVRRSSKVK
jgi:hypothetical protein